MSLVIWLFILIPNTIVYNKFTWRIHLHRFRERSKGRRMSTLMSSCKEDEWLKSWCRCNERWIIIPFTFPRLAILVLGDLLGSHEKGRDLSSIFIGVL